MVIFAALSLKLLLISFLCHYTSEEQASVNPKTKEIC